MPCHCMLHMLGSCSSTGIWADVHDSASPLSKPWQGQEAGNARILGVTMAELTLISCAAQLCQVAKVPMGADA